MGRSELVMALLSPWLRLGGVLGGLILLSLAAAALGAFGNVNPSGPILVALLGMGTIVWGFAAGLIRRNPSLQWENESLPDRIRNLVTFLRLARRSVHIMTGCAHHSLFDRDQVIEAFMALPKTVKITVCHERERDPASARFWSFLDDRKARVVFIASNVRRVPHGMAVDDLHCKMEALDAPDDAEAKHVDYFTYDRPRALAYRIDIEHMANRSDSVSR